MNLYGPIVVLGRVGVGDEVLRNKEKAITFCAPLLLIQLNRCCVCLGEFEIKEELLQVPSCKHVFHIDCMNHWLTTNSTCPLCRCSVIPPIRCPDPPVAAPSPTLPLPSELPLTSNQTAEMVSYSLRHPQLQQQEGSSQSIC